MSQITLVPPDNHTKLPTTRDEDAENGNSYKRTVDALNTMLTEIYAQSGATVVDFGAYPGALDTTTTISGQAGIVAGSQVNAWVVATATADHSIDEHWVDRPIIVAGNIVAGTGFTIYATARDGGRNYGQWTVQWQWR